MIALEAAHINEDTYFSYRIHADIDGIIRGIKEAHKSDSTSAPEVSGAVQIEKSIKGASQAKGSPQEKQLHALLEMLGIDYGKLSIEEVRVLVKVFDKSKLLRNPGRRRKKKQK